MKLAYIPKIAASCVGAFLMLGATPPGSPPKGEAGTSAFLSWGDPYSEIKQKRDSVYLCSVTNDQYWAWNGDQTVNGVTVHAGGDAGRPTSPFRRFQQINSEKTCSKGYDCENSFRLCCCCHGRISAFRFRGADAY
jgi:hypothetical protein